MALLKMGLLERKVLLFVNGIDAGFRLRLFLERFGVRAAVLNAELPLNSRHHILQASCCFMSLRIQAAHAADLQIRRGSGLLVMLDPASYRLAFCECLPACLPNSLVDQGSQQNQAKAQQKRRFKDLVVPNKV